MTIQFHKMNGAGNDFVIIDNRTLETNLNREQIALLCDRQRGIGADGLLAVEPAEQGADYKFRYYNADGGEAEMCGNGARCFGKFAASLTTDTRDHITFETSVGTLTAKFLGQNVRIAMSDPTDLHLHTDITIKPLTNTIHIINTGVPHTVTFVDDLEKINIQKLGAALRYHNHFSPRGTNANFAKVISNQHIAIRTYERGVEAETLACGTGMVACALIHHLLTGAPSPINVDVKGGETLQIGFEKNNGDSFTNVTLTGPADTVFEGEISL